MAGTLALTVPVAAHSASLGSNIGETTTAPTAARKAGVLDLESGCGRETDSVLEGSFVDALRGSRAFLASDCHAGCRFVSGLFARPMTAGLDGLSASRGSHLDFALDAHSLAAGLPG
jgi:hypothetical protein